MKPRTICLTVEVEHAIEELIWYLYDDEQAHCLSKHDDEPRRRHIFDSVQLVLDWIRALDTEPCSDDDISARSDLWMSD